MAIAGSLLAFSWVLSVGITNLLNPPHISDCIAFQTFIISICFTSFLFIPLIFRLVSVETHPERLGGALLFIVLIIGVVFVGFKKLAFFQYELTSNELLFNELILGGSVLVIYKIIHFIVERVRNNEKEEQKKATE